MSFEIARSVYDRHVGRYGDALSAAHARVAGARAGERVLDVGCGPGALTSALAAVVGAEHTSAIDPSATFVEACRARLPGADVRVGAAEALPFADATFALVASQLVINFLADAPRGIAEMRRVAAPGGRVSACVWDYAGEMRMLRAFWDAALELDPDAPDEARTMRYCRAGELAALFRAGGLREVEAGALEAEARYDDFEDYWSPFTSGLAPSGAYCVSLDPDRRAALREACFRRLGSPAGGFTLRARAWHALGRA